MARKVLIFPAILVTLATLLPATAASADPVAIGGIRIGGDMWGTAGFRVGDVIVSIGGQGFISAGSTCRPCEPGSTVSLSGSLSDLDAFVVFSTPSFRLPDLLPPVGTPLTVTLPFLFQGRYHPVTQFGPSGEFFGSGTATGTFFNWAFASPKGPMFGFTGAEFVAGPEPPAPTPEPGTLLLLGTALSGILLRIRRPPAA